MTAEPIIPDRALDSHTGVLGKTGAGKSYTARGLVERLLRLERQVVIVDPTGAWWGLRSGFEIPIFGGRHGDIAISDATGEAVAGVIVDQRTSAIVDLSLLSGGAQKRFMRAFAHRLRAKPPGALWLVLDEADEFLPQQLTPDMTNLFGDLKWMVRRGRLNGFRVMMITQRPAEIAKAVLTQIETLVAHRLTAPQDRKAIEEWVKGHHAPERAREVLSSLASLDQGEAWVWAPDLDLLVRAHMPSISTFDSGRTPAPGEEDRAPPALAKLDLSAIAGALTAAAPDAAIPPGSAQALVRGSAVGAELKKRDDRIAQLETLLAEARRGSGEVVRARLHRARQHVSAVRGQIEELERELANQAKAAASSQPPTDTDADPAARPTGQASAPSDETIGAPAGATAARGRKALFALAEVHPARLTETQWATIAGYARKGGTWGTYKGELRRAGLIEERAGLWGITDAGLDAAGTARRTLPPPGADRARFWGARVPGVRRLIDVLIKRWPHFTTREGLAADLGMAASGGTFGTYLGRLRSNGLIEEQGKRLRLASRLMEAGD